MRRLARAILVVCTVFAALVASALQGNVLCYADDGRHVAVEAPHPRDAHHADHAGHCDSTPAPADEPEHGHCTDVAAEFSATRELQTRGGRSLDDQCTSLTFAPPLTPAAYTTIADHAALPIQGLAGPPAPPGLACLRTIILLV